MFISSKPFIIASRRTIALQSILRNAQPMPRINSFDSTPAGFMPRVDSLPRPDSLWQDRSTVEHLKTPREWNAIMHVHVPAMFKESRFEFRRGISHDVSAGFVESMIPLRSQPKCKKMFVNAREDRVRLAKILFDLDCLATDVAYKHNQDPTVQMGTPAHHKIGVVTARIERIDIHPEKEFSSDHDIFFTGFASWVGNSSMEVTLQAYQCGQMLLEAKFIMVSISADGKGKAPIVPLQITNEADYEMFRRGEVAKQNRLKRDEQLNKVFSMDKPSIDSIWADINENQTMHSSTSNDGRIPVCPMFSTMLENDLCCDNKKYDNAFGNVSGEWLLSEAHEFALENVRQTLGANPKCVGLTDGTFFKPVHFNSNVHFSSQVCYTDGQYAVAVIVISAKEEKVKRKTDENGKQLVGRSTTTNIFNLIFDLGTEKEPVKIVPNTLEEYRRWANARLELEFFQSQQIFSEDR